MRRTNVSFYILVIAALASSLVVAALLIKASPLLVSKPFFLCQQFISGSMIEIPPLLFRALIAGFAAVILTGLLSFLVQVAKTHALLKKMLANKTDMPLKVAKTIDTLGLQGKVVLVRDGGLFSFCYGLFPFIPKSKNLVIVVSSGLVSSLTGKELEAVLLHEQSHLMSGDPIKVLMGKTLSSMFFFLPVLRQLHKNAEAVNELLADQWVTSRQQTSVYLRGALKKILAAPQLNLAAASAVSGPDYFEFRVYRLVNPALQHKFTPSLASLLTSLLFILLSWFLLQTPVAAYHMDQRGNTGYLLCSSNQLCPRQCHSPAQPADYFFPTRSVLEKRCIDKS